MGVPYTAQLNIATLSSKIKELTPGEKLDVQNVPEDQISKLKMNFTLSGFIQVTVNGDTVSASKPNVSYLFYPRIFAISQHRALMNYCKINTVMQSYLNTTRKVN